jgi:hypothetical protein
MRCFQPPADTRFYAGVDLHARAAFVVILDRDGRVAFATATVHPGPRRNNASLFQGGEKIVS